MRHTEAKLEQLIQAQHPIGVFARSGRGELVEEHYHMTIEIIQILGGKVKLTAGNLCREYEKGDVIFAPPFEVHGIIGQTEDAALRVIYCKLASLKVESLQLDFSELFRRNRRLYYVVTSRDAGYEEICSHIDHIFDVCGGFSVNDKIQVVSNLLLIMAQIIRIFQLETIMCDKNYQKLYPVLNYIENHYAEKIRISELSDIIHVCDDNLIRLFKEVTGVTPIEYIMNIRIEYSIELMTTTKLSTEEIAAKSGFGSGTYMARVFKQKLNITPGQYRRR